MESLRDEKGNKQMALGRSLLQNRTRRLGAWLQLKSHQKRFPFINREIDNNPFQSAIMIRSSLRRRLNGSSIILSWKSRLIYSPKRVCRPNQFSFHFRDLSKFLGGLFSKDFNTKSFKRLKTFQIARLPSLNLWLYNRCSFHQQPTMLSDITFRCTSFCLEVMQFNEQLSKYLFKQVVTCNNLQVKTSRVAKAQSWS